MGRSLWYWLATVFAVGIAIVLLTTPPDNKSESACTAWINDGQGIYGQCGSWGVWEPQNTFPWPSSPWMPGRIGIPGSPGYNPGNPFGPSNGPLR